MTRPRLTERFLPEQPPDWQRGALRRAVSEKVDLDAVRRSRRAPEEIESWFLPGAADLSDDKGLCNTLNLLAELRAMGAADDLVGRCAEARANRRRGSGGRPRQANGAFELLFLAFVDGGNTVRQKFPDSLGSDLLRVCGFDPDHPPSAEVVDHRFRELEQDWRQFAAVKNVVVRTCVAAEPRIADACWVDGTLLRSAFRLEFVADERTRATGRTAAALLEPSDPEAISRAHLREIEDGYWGERDAPRVARARLPEQLRVRSADGGWTTYSLFRVDGRLRRSTDVEAGLRSYRDSGTVVWGFYALAGASMFVGEAVEIVVFPADVNEYDGIPELELGLVDALGVRSAVVVSDRGFFLRNNSKFWALRRTGLVTPLKAMVGTATLESLRCELFDEHGVPRCPACGAPGNQAYPGLGLQVPGGRPVIQFRCLAQLTSECARTRTIPCATEHLLLTSPSRLRESFHAFQDRQSTLEHLHRHGRQRFKLGGRELADCLPYPGIAAHQLRIEASLLLLWTRLGLRNGWIAPALITPRINPAGAMRLSGRQDRRSLAIQEAGRGTERLHDLERQRAAKGLHIPNITALDLNGP